MSDDMRQWPRIYLTYQGGSYEQPVLWCQDSIDDDDVAYINAATFAAQAERIAELEAQCENVTRHLAPLFEDRPGLKPAGLAIVAALHITELEAEVARLRGALQTIIDKPDDCWQPYAGAQILARDALRNLEEAPDETQR